MSASDLLRVAAVAGVLAASTSGCARAPLSPRGALAHPVTRDGWTLTVERFPPAPGTPRHARPVVLCHGVLANHYFFQIEGEASLPVVLSRRGFDVWVVDMRGRRDGESEQGRPHGGWLGERYDVDAIAREDLDTLLGYVTAQTGARDVAWVGHSMGGMVAYARLGTIGDPRIGALVTVGSPGLFAPASRNLIRLGEMSGALSLIPAVPMELVAAIDARLRVPFAPGFLTDTIFAADDLPDATYRRLEDYGVNDATSAELRQFVRGVRRGEFVSADGKVSYTDALSAIVVPALIVVGRADELADPLVGREVYDRLGSTDKELVIAGRGEGFATDYGHVDLLVGPNARREIFPRLVAWLEAHP